jgi:hypothetical protein
LRERRLLPVTAGGGVSDENRDVINRRKRRLSWAAALVAGGALIGGLTFLAVPAMAGTSASPSASSSTSSEGGPQGAPPSGASGAPKQRSDEKVLTGTDAEKAKAAALKAVPGATIDRVETDADGAVYEAHLTKPDGTKATVKFDKDFNVTAVQAGMGTRSK